MEDRKVAELHLLESEGETHDAEIQVKAAQTSLSKAEAARKKADEAVANASSFLPAAEAAANAASAALNRTRASLEKTQKLLQDSEKAVLSKEAELEQAGKVIAAAALTAENKRQELRNSELGIDVAKAEVTQAMAHLAAAKSNLADAQAEALGSTLAQARSKCRSTDSEFEEYLHFRDILSLAKYVVVQRTKASDATDERLKRALAALHTSQAAEQGKKDDLADALQLRRQHELDLAITDTDLTARQAEHDEMAARASTSQVHFAADQEKVDAILQDRLEVYSTALNASNHHDATVATATAAADRRHARAASLVAAQLLTENRTEEARKAGELEADMMRALQHAKVWLDDFNASLLLDAKVQAVESAKSAQDKRTQEEAKAAKREERMKALLTTHEKHLALIDSEEYLPQKEKERSGAKAEFDKAEKDVLTTQAKLEGLVKKEAETQEKIHKTYEELGKLREEHAAAQKEYDAQDPEDRKRSFTTSLER